MATLKQLETAFLNAHDAGDTEAAQILADEIKKMTAEPEIEAPVAQPKKGIGAAFGKGLESLLSSGQTALGSVFGSPEEAAQAGLARGEAAQGKYADEVGLDQLKKAYADKGLWGAAKELGHQIPLAIAEQAPNLGVSLGSARLGAMAGAPLGPVGSVAGGIAGAFAPSFIQQLGGDVERQAAVQKEAGQPININLGAAGAAAAVQGGLDVVEQRMLFGNKLVSSLTGIPEKAFFGRSAAQVEKLANERLWATLVNGTAKGAAAEIPAEVAQQMLERAQAGLSLTSPDAMQEYGQTAYQVGLLGPLGIMGRIAEKGAARAELANRPPEQTQEPRELPESEITPVREPAAPEEQLALAGPEKLPALGYTPTPPKPLQLAAPTPPAPPQQAVIQLMDAHDELKAQHSALQEQLQKASAAGDTAKIRELTPQYADLTQRMQASADKIESMGGTTVTPEEFETQSTKTLGSIDKKIAAAQKKLSDAGELGDFEAMPGLATKLDELKAEREKAAADIENRRAKLKTKTVPKGENLPLFGEGMPQQSEVIKPLEAGAGPMLPDTNKGADYEERLQQSNAKLQKLQAVDTSNFAPNEKAAHKVALHDALQENQNIQDDIADLRQVQKAEAGRATPFEKTPVFPKGTIKAQDKTKIAYPSARLAEPFDIFSHFNLLNTAINNRDERTLANLRRAREDADKKAADAAKSKLTPREEVYELLKGSIKGVLRRERTYDVYEADVNGVTKEFYVYDNVAQRLAELRRKITSPIGNAKRSLLQMAHDSRARIEALEEKKKLGKYVAGTEAAIAKEEKEYAKHMGRMDAIQREIRKEVDKMYETTGSFAPERPSALAGLNTKDQKEAAKLTKKFGEDSKEVRSFLASKRTDPETVAKLSERAQEKLKELIAEHGDGSPEVRAFVANSLTSREAKSAKKVNEGKVKVSEAKIAQELGETMAEYQAFAAPYAKRLKAKADQFNKFIETANSRLAELKETLVNAKEVDAVEKQLSAATAKFKSIPAEDVIEKAKANKKVTALKEHLRVVKTPKEDKYKLAESNLLKLAEERRAEYDKLKDELTKVVGEKAVELGKQHPEFKKKLTKAKEAYQEAVGADIQEVKSKRTAQETRRVGKMGELKTASEESRAATHRRQENFAESISGRTETSYERQQREEARERTLKQREAKESKGSAMQVAMTRAAQEKVISEVKSKEKEEGRFARGVEIESPDLTKDQISMAEKGDTVGMLRSIANDSEAHVINRAVAETLADVLDNTRVELHDRLYDDKGNEVLGEAVSRVIKLSRNGGLSQEVLLHEGTHAAVERVIQMAETNLSQLSPYQQAAYKELKAIYARVKADPSITSANAKSSLSEFAAEVLSNRNLQEQLRKKPWRMSDMLRGFASTILRLLGVKNVDTMLGTSIAAVDALMIPSSVQFRGVAEKPVSRNYSAKDIAALDTGSNSMRQFSEQFGVNIKQKDRTHEDVDRIGAEYLTDMENNPEKYVAPVDADKMDYKAQATMSDGKVYDPENILHFVEADITQIAAAKALEDPALAKKEAQQLTKERETALTNLAGYLTTNPDYTIAEMALVAKAASKYGVISGKDGRLRIVNISDNNKHPVAVVGRESANAVVVELRKGKSLKDAFLDGLQELADVNAKENRNKNGWQKFEQMSEAQAKAIAQARAGKNGVVRKEAVANIMQESAVALNAAAAGTPWCTGANVGTAADQIAAGDFYIHYANGKPTVAVRMDGTDTIGEIRGNSPNQGLTEEQQNTARQFLQTKQFKGADEFIEQSDRKKALIALVRGEHTMSVVEVLQLGNVISNEKIDDYAVKEALNFNALTGYLSRSPSKEVRNKLAAVLEKQIAQKYEEGYWLAESVIVDYKETPDTIKEATLFGKQYARPLNKIKGVKFFRLDETMEDGGAFSSMEYADALHLFPGLEYSLPSLKYVRDLGVFNIQNRLGVLTVADGAVIDEVRPTIGDRCALFLSGKAKVNKVTLVDGTASLDFISHDAEYVVVQEPEITKLVKHTVKEYQSTLRTRLRENSIDTSKLHDPSEERNGLRYPVGKDAEINGFVKEMYKRIDSVFGAGTSVKALKDMHPHISTLEAIRYVLTVSLEPKGVHGVLALSDAMFDSIKNFAKEPMPSNPFPARMGTVSAPNIIRPGEEGFTVTAERPRYAPKDDSVGVHKTESGWGFRSEVQPTQYAKSFVAKERPAKDKLLGNIMGLTGRVQLVDQYAALDEALKKGKDAKVISDLEAEQAQYYMRFGQQRSQFATQALTNGPLSLVGEETKRGKEFVYRSQAGANMVQVAKALEKSGMGNSTQLEAMFTAYMAGKRAKQVGWDKLNISNPSLAEKEHSEIMQALKTDAKANAAFEEAAKIYKDYNAGLLDFLVQTGTMTKEKAAELKAIDYVPFYRINKGTGNVELMVDKERAVRIANIKDEPQLKELVGDNTQILPIFTSAVQNTFMLTDMGLRNQMVKDTAFMLRKIGIASALNEGAGPANANTVRFKVKGEDHYVVIDTDAYGVPAQLIVKGMEGIKTTIPAAIKLMGMPADILRSFVTRNPAYAIKQAIRDPLTSWLTTGTDGVPVLNSFKELASMVAGRSEAEAKLMASGAISSNVLTGDQRDMEKALRDISTGKSGWTKLMARADAFAMQGDAATRATVYKDSLNKGMSEMQAMMRTLESMNFNRRGLSPSMQMLNTVIPFFNAQIQGLDVLYRAFKGDMPYSQQMEIRQKMLTRGLLLAAGTLAYAAMMQDDEGYKRAKPEERLGNWFIYTPLSDEPLKVPVPFEMGYLFKSLPEAVFNMAAEDERASDVTKGMGKLVALSNPFSLPQAVKPLTEVVLGKSFFGGDIESQREQKTMLPTLRSRDTTSEFAKAVGSITGDAGLTPIKMDYLIRGYTGSLGVALVSLANPLLNTEAKADREEPTMKTSKMPFIGGLFQPVEGRGTLDAAYERMLEIQQAKGTYDELLQAGKKEEAKDFAEEYGNRIGAASVSGSVQQKLGQYATLRRNVLASNKTTEEKDALLEKIDAAQVKMARQFLMVTDRTTPPASRP